jgi:hypothetical protein
MGKYLLLSIDGEADPCHHLIYRVGQTQLGSF